MTPHQLIADVRRDLSANGIAPTDANVAVYLANLALGLSTGVTAGFLRAKPASALDLNLDDGKIIE